MKKDRNYPMYQPMYDQGYWPGMQQGNVPMQPGMNMQPGMPNQPVAPLPQNNQMMQQMNALKQQVDNLEKRVTKLEQGTVHTYSKFAETEQNYHIM